MSIFENYFFLGIFVSCSFHKSDMRKNRTYLEWYVKLRGRLEGPVSRSFIRKKHKAGQVTKYVLSALTEVKHRSFSPPSCAQQPWIKTCPNVPPVAAGPTPGYSSTPDQNTNTLPPVPVHHTSLCSCHTSLCSCHTSLCSCHTSVWMDLDMVLFFRLTSVPLPLLGLLSRPHSDSVTPSSISMYSALSPSDEPEGEALNFRSRSGK